MHRLPRVFGGLFFYLELAAAVLLTLVVGWGHFGEGGLGDLVGWGLALQKIEALIATRRLLVHQEFRS